MAPHFLSRHRQLPPETIIVVARPIVEHRDTVIERMRSLIGTQGFDIQTLLDAYEFRIVGFMTRESVKTKTIVDDHGVVVGLLQPGDLMLSSERL